MSWITMFSELGSKALFHTYELFKFYAILLPISICTNKRPAQRDAAKPK